MPWECRDIDVKRWSGRWIEVCLWRKRYFSSTYQESQSIIWECASNGIRHGIKDKLDYEKHCKIPLGEYVKKNQRKPISKTQEQLMLFIL